MQSLYNMIDTSIALEVVSSLQVELCLFVAAVLFFRFLERGLRASSAAPSKVPSPKSPPARSPASVPRERAGTRVGGAQRPAKDPCSAPAVDYGQAIKACATYGGLPRARALWEKIEASGAKPDSTALASMVEVLVAAGRPQEAWDLANSTWQQPELYLCNDVLIYSAILRGFSKVRQHHEVVSAYDEMQERRIVMNTVTYNTVLNSMVLCGQSCRVTEVLKKMQGAGPRGAPDTVTYSTIIKGSCLVGDLDTGLHILNFVRHQTSLRPDEFAYNTLLECCARQQRAKDGMQLLAEMREEGVAPSNYTLSIAIKFLGRAHRLKQALDLVQEAGERHGVRPNVQTVTCLMQACFQSAKAGKAFELHNKIATEGEVAMDQKLYTVLGRGCLAINAVNKAAAVVRCAYHLQCETTSYLLLTKGAPQGIEVTALDEILAAVRATDPAQAEALQEALASSRVYQRQTSFR